MSMLKEFKEFISKGNVLDLAVGIIIGAAFTGIVDSFVKDIISPLLGIFGKANFDEMTLTIKDGVVIRYGAFLTNLISFLVVAFVVFLIVKAANRFKKEAPAVPAAPAEDVVLLTQIRDLLAKKA